MKGGTSHKINPQILKYLILKNLLEAKGLILVSGIVQGLQNSELEPSPRALKATNRN